MVRDVEADSATVRTFCAVATLVALLAASCGGDDPAATQRDEASPPRPGVSFLDYSPKPFYKDMDEITVRFTTTGPAGAKRSDRRYFVWVFTGKNNRDKGRCYPEFSAYSGVLGKPGKTYVQTIEMLAEDTDRDNPGPDFHACLGRAQLVVWTGANGGCCPPRKLMRKLSFRVLPPRSG
jgi:hypothetical protein